MGETELIGQLQGTLGKLELALGAVQDGIVWTDPSGVIQWCNSGADRMIGRPHIQILGSLLQDVLPLWRDGAPLADEHPARRALGGLAPDRNRCELGADPLAGAIEASWRTIEISGRADLVFVLRDVTELRHREASLRQSEERYRLAVANVRDHAIFVLDTAGRIVTWNAGAERLYGYADGEIVGRHFSLLMPAPEASSGGAIDELQAASDLGQTEYEGWRVRKDGSRFWANVITTSIRDGRGPLLGFSKVTRDLSQRKRMEDAVLSAKLAAESSNKELESFSYSVAHDLRAPLRAIDGFGTLLAMRLVDKLSKEEADMFARVRAETGRMGRLIDDLLALARVTRAPMRREAVDLSELAREIGARLESERRRPVAFTVAEGLRAEGHPDLLRQVLENLLSNSWKYSSRNASARIEVGASTVGGRRAIFVRDDGAGFDMAHAKKLFQPFSRLHSPGEFEGTGIGLAVVKRIVERHGGRVWAEGAVGRGATFYFTLWEATP